MATNVPVKIGCGPAADARDLVARVRGLEPRVTLALWELRLSRWYPRNPISTALLHRLRTVWAETELPA